MKDGVKGFLTLLSPVVALLIFLKLQEYIRGSDVVLTLFFVAIAFLVLGANWKHRFWAAEVDATRHLKMLLSAIYYTSIVIVVAAPIMSLAVAYILRANTPEYMHDAISGIVRQVPASVNISILDGSLPSDANNACYIAVSKDGSDIITPALPVLTKIFAERIDIRIRVPVAWFAFLIVSVLTSALKICELLAEVRLTDPSVIESITIAPSK